MLFKRQGAAIAAAVFLIGCAISPAMAATSAEDIVLTWNQMVLTLTRHTATYSPPVASRTYAYLGVAAYEAVASGSTDMATLAGQLNELTAGPPREAGKTYSDAVVLESALSAIILQMFENTGPTGQRAYQALKAKLDDGADDGVDAETAARSAAYGAAVAAHILDWAKDDGGAVIANMGFPSDDYKLTPGNAHWVPTNSIAQQQKPLLPKWGANRTFAMPQSTTCPVPSAIAYSEDPNSDFYKQAKEVYDTKNSLTADQAAIARFWADDPMLSFTPPGHWMEIGMEVIHNENLSLEKTVDLMMRLSVAEADAFIGCWQVKYVYDVVRPITYIHRLIDPNWQTLISTPPFPEYTSGHSVASAAAATVLSSILGDHYAFTDTTGGKDNLPMRQFSSFDDAANQAGISRLYAGIHYRAAIDNGLAEGRCIGAYAVNLKTWK
jgi:PAP2 superfamily protein